MNAKEWRVVSVNVWGTFRVFDTEEQARNFIRGSTLANDEKGPYRLESRPIGGTKDDWQERAVLRP